MAERNPFNELLERLDEDDWEQIEEELMQDDNGPSGPAGPRRRRAGTAAKAADASCGGCCCRSWR